MRRIRRERYLPLISQVGEPIPDFRPSDQFGDFALKQADMLLWRSRRDENGRPDVRREVGIAGLRDDGHARQCLGPGIALSASARSLFSLTCWMAGG